MRPVLHAPEQILDQAIDTYTDVYALGAVLYRMLTGHRVYRGRTREELIQLHLQAPIPSLTLWRSDLPKALDDCYCQGNGKGTSTTLSADLGKLPMRITRLLPLMTRNECLFLLHLHLQYYPANHKRTNSRFR